MPRIIRLAAVLASLAVAASAAANPTLRVATPPLPDCGSLVVIKCDRRDAGTVERAKQEAARRSEVRRSERATVELGRIIIEGDAERRVSPEESISRALSRPLLRQGEYSFPIGESAQCTCLNRCPPWPLPCCQCTDQPGSRHATSPGSKPTN
jgi:hypothetical protein